jgi:ubiquitin carboxyl-terminal hydrolase 36/42
MHEVGFPLDLSVFTRLIATLFFLAVGVFYFLKNTAAKYFDIGAAAAGGFDRDFMAVDAEDCSVCGNFSTKKCSRCKSVRYCSAECQRSDWSSGHQRNCRDYGITTLTPSAKNGLRFRASPFGDSSASSIALISERGQNKSSLKPREVLFPYEEFVEYFNWDNPELAPCGLMNCGNRFVFIYFLVYLNSIS